MPISIRTHTMRLSTLNSQYILALLLCMLTSCTSLSSRTVKITEAQLQNKLAEHLNLPISLLKIIDISLSNPIVKLDAGTERLNAELDTKIANPITGKPLFGKINISGKLRYDSTSSSIVLSEAKLEKFGVDGLDLNKASNPYADLINTLVEKVGSELLNELPLYRVKPEDLVIGGTSYTPKDLKIVDGALQVTLTPK